MNARFAILLGVILCFCCHESFAQSQSASRSCITWTFASAHQIGEFANGDPWVVGPITITGISPASTTIDGRTVHGTMLNPIPGNGVSQGFDSSMDGSGYIESLNVAQQLPLTVSPGSSLVSTISNPEPGRRPQLDHAAILTVLDSIPSPGSFRPPYVGTDKPLFGTVENLNDTILRNLPVVSNMPNIDDVVSGLSRSWIEINTQWTGRTMHPTFNQPHYGREMSYLLGKGLLLLHLDIDPAKKEALYISLVQYGIDVYAAVKHGALYRDSGGHNQGRKMPMILAGMALGSNEILQYAAAQSRCFVPDDSTFSEKKGVANANCLFQEDRQTWYVQQRDVGRTMYSADDRQRDTYRQEQVGMPEWGAQHTRAEQRDGSNWKIYYRDNVGSSTIAHGLSAHLLNAVEIWNWPAVFDYWDRFYEIEKGNAKNARNFINLFERDMWEAYRSLESQPKVLRAPENFKILETIHPVSAQ